MDRAEIVRALECCTEVDGCDGRCPYWDDFECLGNLKKDALRLLKDQEQMEDDGK